MKVVVFDFFDLICVIVGRLLIDAVVLMFVMSLFSGNLLRRFAEARKVGTNFGVVSVLMFVIGLRLSFIASNFMLGDAMLLVWLDGNGISSGGSSCANMLFSVGFDAADTALLVRKCLLLYFMLMLELIFVDLRRWLRVGICIFVLGGMGGIFLLLLWNIVGSYIDLRTGCSGVCIMRIIFVVTSVEDDIFECDVLGAQYVMLWLFNSVVKLWFFIAFILFLSLVVVMKRIGMLKVTVSLFLLYVIILKGTVWLFISIAFVVLLRSRLMFIDVRILV